jgi:hypothetical protein
MKRDKERSERGEEVVSYECTRVSGLGGGWPGWSSYTSPPTARSMIGEPTPESKKKRGR